MYIGNLQHLPLKTIADTFNAAFSDYVLPMRFSEDQFRERLLRDNISLEYSVGAFEGDQLAGFILQGIGEWGSKITAYNGGTGVIPQFRGQRLTQQLYAYSLPQLRKAGVEQCLLEVIDTNQVAKKVYLSLGFKPVRTLISYKGFLNSGKNRLTDVANITYREVADIKWEEVKSFGYSEPSWQNNQAALSRIRHLTRPVEILAGNMVIGYGVQIKNGNRIPQFAVAPFYRRKGIATQLFHYFTEQTDEPVVVINVDEQSASTHNFLQALGLTPFIWQKEMILKI